MAFVTGKNSGVMTRTAEMGVEEHQRDDERHVDHKKQDQWRRGHAQDELGDLLGDMGDGQHPHECFRASDEDEHQRGGDAGPQGKGGQIAQFYGFVKQVFQKEAVAHRHGRGLGGAENAGVDAADDDHHETQGGPIASLVAVASFAQPALSVLAILCFLAHHQE